MFDINKHKTWHHVLKSYKKEYQLDNVCYKSDIIYKCVALTSTKLIEGYLWVPWQQVLRQQYHSIEKYIWEGWDKSNKSTIKMVYCKNQKSKEKLTRSVLGRVYSMQLNVWTCINYFFSNLPNDYVTCKSEKPCISLCVCAIKYKMWYTNCTTGTHWYRWTTERRI